jgi:hypothetical protein
VTVVRVRNFVFACGRLARIAVVHVICKSPDSIRQPEILIRTWLDSTE